MFSFPALIENLKKNKTKNLESKYAQMANWAVRRFSLAMLPANTAVVVVAVCAHE
jgi:hypothetical protein